MRQAGSLVVALAVAASALAGQGADRDLRLEPFTSATFGNTRTLRILLPPGYDAPENRDRRYPALYLNDGQNLFDAATSTFTGREWRVDETVRRADRDRPHPAARRRRHRPRRPARAVPRVPSLGRSLPRARPSRTRRARAIPAFLVDEVIPFVEARYRVARDPEQRGIGGSSAGGLAAINAVVTRPGVFGRLLVESPSIYVDDAHILKAAAGVTTWPSRIALGAGTAEGAQRACDTGDKTEPEVVSDLRRFAAVLRHAGVADARIRLTVTPCATHDEDAWARRLPDALTFLYAQPVGSTQPRR